MLDATSPLRAQIVELAMKASHKMLDSDGAPNKASHLLCGVVLSSGKKVNMHVVHAVDAVITDGENIVMINRKFDPAKGKPALPGGFLDPNSKGEVETLSSGAAREAAEEAGIELGEGVPVGERQFNRPFDVRVAKDDGLKEKYGIAEGDIFLVSTQAVKFEVADLKEKQLVAGDDATPGSARLMKIEQLNGNNIGIKDHLLLIDEAVPRTVSEKAVESAKANLEKKTNVRGTFTERLQGQRESQPENGMHL